MSSPAGSEREKASASPVVSLTVPSKDGTGSRSSSRTASPARLPTELALKVRTQKGRLELMLEELSVLDSLGDCSLEELDARTAQLDQLNKDFLKEHSYFEVTWPSAFLEHAYFQEKTHLQFTRAYSASRRIAAKLRGPLVGEQGRAASRTVDEGSSRARLPQIKLPKFCGEYLEWPAFSELFISLITDDARLGDVERLHYLRGCLETGSEAAQLISSLPLIASSFRPSWEILNARYSNKRLHIQSHLDAMFDVTPLSSTTAAGLNGLITKVSEANIALRSLGVDANMWECILVHHVSRNLDRATREAWETSLGSSREFPTFEKLEAFMTARARAFERIEGSTSSKGDSSKAATQQGTTADQSPSASASPTSVSSPDEFQSYSSPSLV